MKTQINVFKNEKIQFLLLLVFLALAFFFLTTFPKAYASQEKFTVTAVNYEEGTWATENVVLTATAKSGFETGTISYSLDGGYTFLQYQEQVLVETEGENLIIFKFTDQNGIDTEEISIEVKLDKTKPTVEKIELSEEEFTTQPVKLQIFLADSSAYQSLYKAKIFGEIYLPLPEFLQNGQIVFEYIAESNTVFYVGDIILYDQAENQVIYDAQIDINNIDDKLPDFNLSLLSKTDNKTRQIEILLGYIHSGVKEIILIYPSGKTKNLPIKNEQIFSVKQNGTYIVKIISNSDMVFSRGILVNDINKADLTVLWLALFVLILSGIGIASLVIFSNKNKIIKQIIKK